jgi:type I restriction enzyme M protein
MVEKSYPKVEQMKMRGNEVFSLVRQKWIHLTPEEKVRQEFLRVLVNEYGYSVE